MPKRKFSKSSIPKKGHPSNNLTNDREGGGEITDVTNIPSDSNEEDFLDNTQKSMNKRKKTIEKFFSRTRILPGKSQPEEALVQL